MRRWTLLRHDRPDSSWHYDWVIDRVNVEHADMRGLNERDLFTFRLASTNAEIPPVLDLSLATLAAVRLPEHRRLYLDYEGVLTRERGTVRRIAGGLCTWSQVRPMQLDIHIQPSSSDRPHPAIHWQGMALGPQGPQTEESSWIFTLQT